MFDTFNSLYNSSLFFKISSLGEREIMTEQEYILEVLCTCYPIEELNLRYRKLCNDNVHNNSNSSDVIDNVSIALLNEAIRCYNKEKYIDIRNEMLRNKIKICILMNNTEQ